MNEAGQAERRIMFISKKKFKELEKRIAKLEMQVQSQQVNLTINEENLAKAVLKSKLKL